jgi:hypothetical protein
VSTRPDLAAIFATHDHAVDAIHELVSARIAALADSPALISPRPGTTAEIDLGGRTFVLDRPLLLRNLQLLTLCNGTLVAGPGFPEGEFLIHVKYAHGLHLRNLFLECSKRASGVHLEDFFRVRIEDCYLVHQRDYGIYSAPRGNNHELEVVKCHIAEYLHRDGLPENRSNHGVIPPFNVDANRTSTGVFLGQADNVVADCNINLCRTGIHCGMRANRIHGNHITGGASIDLELYRGIELNNGAKSSALIVNNYIDNCCLWIDCDANPARNLRNYIHVTNNLFYRGYNHPRDGTQFSHIVVNPREPGSLLANLHVCDNKFYNQPENLEGVKPRVIRPLRVNGGQGGEETPWLDHARLSGVTMRNNAFTNSFPTFVTPVGTCVTKVVKTDGSLAKVKVEFQDEIALGHIKHASAEVIGFEGPEPPRVAIRRIHEHTVSLWISGTGAARIAVTAIADGDGGQRYEHFVH